MPHPPAALLRRLAAALLLAQSVLAPALCLARAGHAAPLALALCTAEGLRLVHLPERGTDEAPAAQDGPCLACHALPQAAAPPWPALTAPAWAEAGGVDSAPLPAAPRPAIRGPPSGARAPPSGLA